MTTLAIPARTVPALPHQIDVLDAWLAGRSVHTLRAYRKDLDDFAAFLGAPGASEAVSSFLILTGGEANATALYYRAHLTDRGLSPATVARRLAAVKSVVRCARMLGRVSWEVEVEAPRAEAFRDTRGPGADGWKAMVRSVRGKAAEGDAAGIRDLAIVRLLHDLGLRRGEVCALDYESIDQERGTVAVVGKGRTQAKHLTLPEPTARAVAAWLEVRGTAPGPLFTRLDNAGAGTGRIAGESIRRIVLAVGEEAGLSGPVRPHGLRHQAITSVLAGSNGNIEAGMAFARHSNPRTTMIYNDNRRDVAGEMAKMIAGEE